MHIYIVSMPIYLGRQFTSGSDHIVRRTPGVGLALESMSYVQGPAGWRCDQSNAAQPGNHRKNRAMQPTARGGDANSAIQVSQVSPNYSTVVVLAVWVDPLLHTCVAKFFPNSSPRNYRVFYVLRPKCNLFVVLLWILTLFMQVQLCIDADVLP